MRVSSAGLWMAMGSKRVGVHSCRASSMAWELFSSSVRRTVALLVRPVARASWRDFLKERRCERRWIMGQRSVERPRRVSTALNGELGIAAKVWMGQGKKEDSMLAFGDVPRERAAITS